jgi:aryl-alcohol dehydrogenase-like predicted oxidoreductase
MEKRKLGNSDLEITRIGLGAWALGGPDWRFGWGPQDDRESIEAIHKAIDLGINWIDTAAAYGLGHSEQVIARAVAGKRDKVIIATKCSLVWQDGDYDVRSCLKAESIRREADASLKRLNLDVIDLYQIHKPIPDEDVEEGWGAIADLIHEGKVRYAGVSNFNVEQIKRAQAIHPVTSLQPPYSMVRREVEDELLEYCARNQIGVIVFSPMQAGILTEKFTREWFIGLDEKDWRRRNKQFIEPRLSANLSLVEKLRPIAARYGRPVSQLAIAWVLRRPEVTAAIVGSRRPSQIEETAVAASWKLPDEAVAEIENLLVEHSRTLGEQSR